MTGTAFARRVHFGAPQKFGNKPTVTDDGVKHASKREAKRWRDLTLLQEAGRVRNLKRQVPFAIKAPSGYTICKYIADFTFDEYEGGTWTPIVEDAKGYPTAVYKLKRKLMKHLMGIEIRET